MYKFSTMISEEWSLSRPDWEQIRQLTSIGQNSFLDVANQEKR